MMDLFVGKAENDYDDDFGGGGGADGFDDDDDYRENNNTNNDNDNNLLSPIVEETEGRGFRFPDMNSPSLGMADCVVADHNDNMVDHTVDGEGVNDGSRAYNDHNDNHRNGDVMENFEEFKMSKGNPFSYH